MFIPYRLLLGFTVALFMFGLVSCDGGREEDIKAVKVEKTTDPVKEGALPEGHPPLSDGNMDGDKGTTAVVTPDDVSKRHPDTDTAKEVKLSDEVKVKWASAKIRLLDKESGKGEEFTLKVGDETKLKDKGITIKIEALVPHYVIYDTYIGSKTNDPINPAILVVLKKDKGGLAKGWIFEKFPDFNSFKNDRYDIILLPSAAIG